MTMTIDKLKIKSFCGIFFVFLTALSLVKILSTETTFTFLSNFRFGLIAAVWIIVPAVIIVYQNKKFNAYGLSLSAWKQSIKMILISGLIFLCAYLIGYYRYAVNYHIRSFNPVVPENLVLLTLNIFLFTALPEEFFFRGYLQSELNYILGKKWPASGLFLTAIIFTLSHIVLHMDYSKANLIFLSLILGWLREKTGNIAASTGFHTLANVTHVCSQELFTI